LEYFDSPDLEIFDPVTKLTNAPLVTGSPGLHARSRFYDTSGAFSWAPCIVRAFDRSNGLWRIEWAGTGKGKWVKRLNLLFEGEDREGFRHRLHAARRRQEEVRF